MAELNGQVAVVTGAGRGIGEAISLRLATMGATVVLVARDAARLEAVRAQIDGAGGRSVVAAADLRSVAAVDALGEQVRHELGRVDIVVNNAGMGHFGKPLYELEPEQWDEVMETNLRGPYLMMRALVPLMIEGGRGGHVINVGSLAGKNPLANGAAYAASKWGLNGLTASAAEELRAHRIRVSLVAPGSVATGCGGGAGDAERDARKIQPEDLAHVVAMLVTQAPGSFVSEVLVRPTVKP